MHSTFSFCAGGNEIHYHELLGISAMKDEAQLICKNRLAGYIRLSVVPRAGQIKSGTSKTETSQTKDKK